MEAWENLSYEKNLLFITDEHFSLSPYKKEMKRSTRRWEAVVTEWRICFQSEKWWNYNEANECQKCLENRRFKNFLFGY